MEEGGTEFFEGTIMGTSAVALVDFETIAGELLGQAGHLFVAKNFSDNARKTNQWDNRIAVDYCFLIRVCSTSFSFASIFSRNSRKALCNLTDTTFSDSSIRLLISFGPSSSTNRKMRTSR